MNITKNSIKNSIASLLRGTGVLMTAVGMLTIASGTLTSCSTDDLTTATPGDNFPQDGRVRISTSLTSAGTTVLTRADGEPTAYNGKTLGLFVDYSDTPATDGSDGTSSVEDTYNRFNVKYTQDGSGNWTQDLTAPDYDDLKKEDTFQSSTPALWKNTSAAVSILYAYAPYVESANAIPNPFQAGSYDNSVIKRFVRFNIPEDQTDGIDKADLVSGAVSNFVPYKDLVKQAVNITLKHRLTKLTVALTLGDQFDGEKTDDGKDIAVASMTLHNTLSAVILKPGDEKQYYVSGSDYFDKDIQMHLTTVTTTEGTTEKPAFEAIGDFLISSSMPLLTLKLNNGRIYTYTITGEVGYAFESAKYLNTFHGHAFLLNLKVGKDKLEIADAADAVTVVGWDDNSGAGNEITGGEATEVWNISNVDFNSNDINTLIASHVIDGKLALTGSFGDKEKEAQGKFEKIAAYIRNHVSGSDAVTALDFSATTGVTKVDDYYWEGGGAGDYYACNLQNSALITVNLPASVTSLFGLSSCEALTTVTGGSDAITEGSFYGCTALTTVPTNFTTIIQEAFSGCTSLKEYSSTVTTKLVTNAFLGCTALTMVNCPNVTSLGNRIFNNCTVLTDITLTAETFSFVRSFISSNLGGARYDPFTGIKNRENVTLHLNANQESNISQNSESNKCEWKPVTEKTADNDTGLEQAVDLSGFKAVYCGTKQVYSTAQ